MILYHISINFNPSKFYIIRINIISIRDNIPTAPSANPIVVSQVKCAAIIPAFAAFFVHSIDSEGDNKIAPTIQTPARPISTSG